MSGLQGLEWYGLRFKGFRASEFSVEGLRFQVTGCSSCTWTTNNFKAGTCSNDTLTSAWEACKDHVGIFGQRSHVACPKCVI